MEATMTTTTLLSRFHDEVFTDPETLALAGFLAGYSGLTRTAYALDLRIYAGWLANHNIRLFDARRAHIEAFARDHALISLLALNGLRVSEAIGARIKDLALERGHRTLTVLRKGGKTVVMPLAPRTARAVDLAIGERYEGTILYANDGGPLNRHAAARIVRRIGKAAGINKKIGPHTLRHGFITAALDAGVPLRDVQEAASHADPRTTMRYDRARVSLDRHATYIVSTFIAGAAR
jgi:integrase